MTDYARRVAQADTFPKLLRLNAHQHGSEIALREVPPPAVVIMLQLASTSRSASLSGRAGTGLRRSAGHQRALALRQTHSSTT